MASKQTSKAKVKQVVIRSNVQLAPFRHLHLGVILEPAAGQSFSSVVAEGKQMLAGELRKAKAGVQVDPPFTVLVDTPSPLDEDDL